MRDGVIPAWSAGIQIDMDVSGRILRTWMPAIHAGMTEKKFAMILCFSRSVSEHKIMRYSPKKSGEHDSSEDCESIEQTEIGHSLPQLFEIALTDGRKRQAQLRGAFTHE